MKSLKILLCFVVSCFVLTMVARADTFGGVTFNISTSGNTLTLEITGSDCTIFSDCTRIGEIAVQAFNLANGTTPDDTTQPSGWLEGALGTVGGNGGPGGAASCNANSNQNAVCWAVNGSSGGGQLTSPYDYIFTATFDPADILGLVTFHVQATFYDDTVSKETKVGQISEDLTGGPPSVPEPASLLLLGTGLGTLGLFGRRKLRK